MYPRKQWQYLHLIPQDSHFLWLCSSLPLILWICSERLLIIFENDLEINLVIWINCNLRDRFLVISSLFLSVPVTAFSNAIEKVIHFSMFSPKQVHCV